MTLERLPREVIAMRVAKELQDGNVVNLGIGIPSLCSQYDTGTNSLLSRSFGNLFSASAAPSTCCLTPLTTGSPLHLKGVVVYLSVVESATMHNLNIFFLS